MTAPAAVDADTAVLAGADLRKRYGPVRAVDGVSLTLSAGETLALVGESGSGKSTVARMLVGLVHPDDGEVLLDGQAVRKRSRRSWRRLRSRVQIVFQDASGSLDPRLRVQSAVAEPLLIAGGRSREQVRERVLTVLELVGLDARHLARYPHELSGGQRQRVAIARALMLEPEVLILDEPVTALDVSVQAQVLGLLQSLQNGLGIAYLLVAHDLAVVRNVAQRVAVMYRGRIVEEAAVDEIFNRASHPYTQALLAAAPSTDPVVERARSHVVLPPDVGSVSAGCRFRARCSRAEARCETDDPALEPRAVGHPVACHFAGPDTHAQGPV